MSRIYNAQLDKTYNYEHNQGKGAAIADNKYNGGNSSATSYFKGHVEKQHEYKDDTSSANKGHISTGTSISVEKQQDYQDINNNPDIDEAHKKKMLCYNTINHGSCVYGNKCIYSHSLAEQKIEPLRHKVYTILKNKYDLSKIDLINDKKLFDTMLLLTKLCFTCCKGQCPGGYNCRNGAINAKFRICYEDLMYGNCRKNKCTSVHLSERLLIPYIQQKKEKEKELLTTTSSSTVSDISSGYNNRRYRTRPRYNNMNDADNTDNTDNSYDDGPNSSCIATRSYKLSDSPKSDTDSSSNEDMNIVPEHNIPVTDALSPDVEVVSHPSSPSPHIPSPSHKTKTVWDNISTRVYLKPETCTIYDGKSNGPPLLSLGNSVASNTSTSVSPLTVTTNAICLPPKTNGSVPPIVQYPDTKRCDTKSYPGVHVNKSIPNNPHTGTNAKQAKSKKPITGVLLTDKFFMDYFDRSKTTYLSSDSEKSEDIDELIRYINSNSDEDSYDESIFTD